MSLLILTMFYVVMGFIFAVWFPKRLACNTNIEPRVLQKRALLVLGAGLATAIFFWYFRGEPFFESLVPLVCLLLLFMGRLFVR